MFLSTFLSKVIGFFSKAFSSKFLTFTLMLIIALLVFFNLNTCDRLKQVKIEKENQQKLFDQNMSALKDSLTVTFDKKLKAYVYDKDIFLTEFDELKNYNQELSNKINKLKGEVIAAIDSKVQANIPPVEVDNTVEILGKDKYGLRWKSEVSDEGFSQYIRGISKFKIDNNKVFADKTLIDSNMVALNITYGFKEEDNKYKVWAISKSQYVKLNSLEGAFFIDKPAPTINQPVKYKRPWVIGPYIGYGINFDNKMGTARIGPSIGISIQYNMLNFGKKIIKQ